MPETSDDIVCFELGSEQLPWVGSSALLDLDREAIQRLAQESLIEVTEKGGDSHISGVDRVGLVQLPSGRRLVIRSKIESLVLLEWLAYLGEFPPLEVWLADAGVTAGVDFHTCIARLFLYEMEKLTRLHLRKDYIPIFSNESTIRGRIMTTQLYRKLHRLPYVPQKHRSRQLDTPYNIVLALALDKLPLLLAYSTANDCTLLARLRDLWAHIRRDVADPVSAVTGAQWACPPGYRSALQLARLILIGAALDPEAGYGGQAFTLSLASMWERSLRRMVEEICGETGWIPSPDSARTRQWDDSAGRNDPTRWLNADVMATHGNLCWVLDAKYKRAFGNESRADRFQMCAYALAFDADVVSLVYPLAQSGYHRRTLLEAVVGLKHVSIDSISLPMCAGPESCKLALVELCKTIWSTQAAL
jgi:5-methylcytosine-specific restriction endonuclease McrBC regulatory subunit McrC